MVGLGATLAVCALLILLGGLATGGRATIAVRFFAGWGVACAVLTLWGVGLPGSLAWPAALLALAGVGSLLWRSLRPSRDGLADLGRILVLSLPLLGLLASVRPSLPDTFLNLLPNAAYLVDYGHFPRSDAAQTISIFPALPYNTQFPVYLASLLAGELVESGLVFFNIAVQIAGALFFGRLVAELLGPGNLRFAVPVQAVGWRDGAIGLALVAAVNPGFMPKIAFSSMGEPSTEVALAIATALMLAALPLPAAREGTGSLSTPLLLQAALVLLAFINVRQSNIGLLAALGAAVTLLILLDPPLRQWRILGTVIASMVPAGLLYLAWRGYVLEHFTVGELKVLPISQWDVAALPRILGAIVRTVAGRPFLYVCFGAAFVALGTGWRARPWGQPQRMLLLLAGLTLGYNGFLLFTYVAHFASAEDPAHSYYRYTSHLGQVLVLGLTLWTACRMRGRLASIDCLHRHAGTLAIGLAVALPLLFLNKLRFDLVEPQPIVWDMIKRFVPDLARTSRLGLALPGDNGTVSLQIRGYLALTAPRRPDLDYLTVERGDPAALADLARQGVDTLLLSCATGTAFAGDTPSAVLMRYEAARWRVVDRYDYPPASSRWDPVLAAAPLCRTPAQTPEAQPADPGESDR